MHARIHTVNCRDIAPVFVHLSLWWYIEGLDKSKSSVIIRNFCYTFLWFVVSEGGAIKDV
jgi:hypothetical protein